MGDRVARETGVPRVRRRRMRPKLEPPFISSASKPPSSGGSAALGRWRRWLSKRWTSSTPGARDTGGSFFAGVAGEEGFWTFWYQGRFVRGQMREEGEGSPPAAARVSSVEGEAGSEAPRGLKRARS